MWGVTPMHNIINAVVTKESIDSRVHKFIQFNFFMQKLKPLLPPPRTVICLHECMKQEHIFLINKNCNLHYQWEQIYQELIFPIVGLQLRTGSKSLTHGNLRESIHLNQTGHKTSRDGCQEIKNILQWWVSNCFTWFLLI
jgi:hypothetical protein